MYIAHFSPTGGTRKAAEIIGRALDPQATEIDLSSPKSVATPLDLSHDEVLLVAVTFHICLLDREGQIFAAGGEGDAIYRTGFSKIGDGYRFHRATSWGMYSSPL